MALSSYMRVVVQRNCSWELLMRQVLHSSAHLHVVVADHVRDSEITCCSKCCRATSAALRTESDSNAQGLRFMY